MPPRKFSRVLGSHITIRDLTIKRARYHPIHIYPDDGDVIGTLISNVHIIDPGQQAIKINQDSGRRYSADFGKVERFRTSN